jgi:hypothetical protein
MANFSRIQIKYGYTRGQKAILLILVSQKFEIQRFPNLREHFDALALFNFLVFREGRLRGQTEDYFKFYSATFQHEQCVNNPKTIDNFKDELGIQTSLQFRDFGRSLALEFLQNY